MIAFILHKTNKHKKDNENKSFFVFEKQTFLENVSEIENYSIVSNCLLTDYTKPENNNSKIIEEFKINNNEFLKNIKGEFSFGIWDNNKKTFFGARDRVGVKPFYYYNDNNIFIYSSSLKYIKERLKLTYLNKFWISDLLSGIVYDKTSTLYKEIFRLPPAHYLIVNENNFEIKKYWELKANKIENITDNEAVLLFKEKLFNAVNSRFFANITGTELSGGLDSSGVTSIVAIHAKELNSKIYSFSHRLSDNFSNKIYPFTDEREFSNLVLNKYPNINFSPIYSEEKGIIEPINKVIDILGSIPYNTLTYFFDELFETAQKNNVKILMSGFGGDEIASNHGKYYLSDLAKQFKFKKLQAELNSNFFSKKYISFLLQKNIPSLFKFYKILKNNKTWQETKFNNSLINKEFAEKTNLKKRYWQRYNYSNVKTFDNFIISKFNEHYIQSRLETVGEVARHYEIEQTHPLLDTELIETYLNLPNHLKYKNGINRFLFREALNNVLPQEIYKRNDKTKATVPNIWHRMQKDLNKIQVENIYINPILFNKQKLLIETKINNIKIDDKKINQNIFQQAITLQLFLNSKHYKASNHTNLF